MTPEELQQIRETYVDAALDFLSEDEITGEDRIIYDLLQHIEHQDKLLQECRDYLKLIREISDRASIHRHCDYLLSKLPDRQLPPL